MQNSNSDFTNQNNPGLLQVQKTPKVASSLIGPASLAENDTHSTPVGNWNLNDKSKDFEKQIKANEYNTEAWLGLLSEALSTKNQEFIENVFGRFLSQFPTSVKHYKSYAEYEYEKLDYEKLEQTFTKILVPLKSVDLWVFYLDYIKDKNRNFSKTAKLTNEQTQVVDQSYSFALQNVGIDRDSYPIWKGYIEFLNETEYFSPWEISKKNDKIRSVYQRAISIPINQIELIWKDYDTFENTINKPMAKKQLGDWSASYMTARSVLRASNKYVDSIQHYAPSDELCFPPTWNDREVNYLMAWKSYIDWEKTNPQKIESVSELEERIIYVHQKAILALRFYPEAWVEAAQYLWGINRQKQAIGLLEDSIKILPKSLSVHFQLAEFEELNNNNAACNVIFKALIKSTEQDIDEKRKQFQLSIADLKNKLENMTELHSNQDKKNLHTPSQDRGVDGKIEDDDDNDIEMEDIVYDLSLTLDLDESELGIDFKFEDKTQSSVEEAISQQYLHKKRKMEQLINKVEELSKSKLNFEKRMHTQVWISYLRFSMRTDGIDGARSVFKAVRTKSIENVTYHIFVASAMIEYHVTKNPAIAGRLFELGLKYFGTEPDYAVEYMKYLINTNDGNNSRALFERMVLQKNLDCTPLWDLYLNYEYQYGDLRTVYNLDNRFVSQDESETLVNRFINRYGFLDLNPMRSVCFGDFNGLEDFGGDSNDDGSANADALTGRVQNDQNLPNLGNFAASENEVQMPSDELRNVIVGSIRNGKYLNRSLLLSSVSVPNSTKPNFSMWNSYKPHIASSSMSTNLSGNKGMGGHNTFVSGNDQDRNMAPPTNQNNWQTSRYDDINQKILPAETPSNSRDAMLLASGDVLGFLYSKVSVFPNLMLPSLNIAALVGSIASSPVPQPLTSSSSIFSLAMNKGGSNQFSADTSNRNADGYDIGNNAFSGGNQGLSETGPSYNNNLESGSSMFGENHAPGYPTVASFNQDQQKPALQRQSVYPKRGGMQGSVSAKNKTLHFGNRNIPYQSVNYSGFNPNNLRGRSSYYNQQNGPGNFSRGTQSSQFQKNRKRPRFNNEQGFTSQNGPSSQSQNSE